MGDPWLLRLPLEQHEFEAEARAHGREDAVGAGWLWVVGEGFRENEEDGRGGEIANLAEALPGEREGVGREAEGGLRGLEDLRAAGVEDPGRDL